MALVIILAICFHDFENAFMKAKYSNILLSRPSKIKTTLVLRASHKLFLIILYSKLRPLHIIRPLLGSPKGSLNPCPADSRYTLPLETVQIQISWLLKKPTDMDLHCLPLSM